MYLKRVRRRSKTKRPIGVMIGALLAVLVVLGGSAVQAASTRLEDRKVTMNSARAGEVTDYTFSWRFMSEQAVGSVDMQFCTNPIPYLECYPPAGMDVSNAVLDSQSGETGFSISSQGTNHLILSRTPGVIAPEELSTYVFRGIKNPTNTDAFAVRLQVYAGPDLSGAKGDFGGLRGSVTHEIMIETQVPPMLIFCLAEQVSMSCSNSNKVYYAEMGELKPNSTLTATTEMAVGTNASAGFAIMAEGIPPAAGTNIIDAMNTPATSSQGVNQFGINLVKNSQPDVGADSQGVWANAQPTADYGTSNQFKFVSGDVVAESPNVSLMKKFTVSYIVNSAADLRPGIYTTSITFIASGRF